MKTIKQVLAYAAGFASIFLCSGAVHAADLGGSVKDGGYVTPMPEIIRGGAGPCYVRADVGYSFANSPDIKWPVNNDTISGHFDGGGNFVETGRTSTFLTDNVTGTSRESGTFGEVGGGCGQGSRGMRAEVMFGYHGSRKVDGEPGAYSITYVDDGLGSPPPPNVPIVDDPLHTSITSYTMMLNVYRDMGQFGRVTPYVGAGIGGAYHMVDETYFTGNVNLPARIHGDNDLSFAWALMAGIGYQVSDRAIVDFGYRYLDLGKATSERVDSAGFVNPRVNFDDLTSHEVKVGLRYHFGGGDCCAEYAPMK